MFEDLRKDGEASPFFQQEDGPDPLLDAPSKKKRSSGGGGGGGLKISRNFLGLTPFQRFAVSLALFMMVCIAGVAILFATGGMVFF